MFVSTLNLFGRFNSFDLEVEHIVRILVAVLLGGLIGLERELRDKPAGLRTIVLICVGAALFTIVSEIVGGPDWDTTRIAAQVVTGIGFLGAGAILRDRSGVYGITTAATIWAVAAIGMGVGFGCLALATWGTAAILAALFVLDFVEKWIGNRRDLQEYYFVARKEADTFERVAAMFAEAGLRVRKRTCHEEGSSLVFRLRAMGAKASHERLLINLAQADEYELRQP